MKIIADKKERKIINRFECEDIKNDADPPYKSFKLPILINWSTIKSLTSNNIIKVNYLILVLSPAIMKLIENLSLKGIPHNTIKSIKTSVILLYFASVVLLILYLLYLIFAPKTVKRFKNADTLSSHIKNEQIEHVDNTGAYDLGFRVWEYVDNSKPIIRIVSSVLVVSYLVIFIWIFTPNLLIMTKELLRTLF